MNRVVQWKRLPKWPVLRLMGKGKDRGRASGEEAFPEERERKYWAGAAVTKTQTLGEGAAAKWVPFGKEVKLQLWEELKKAWEPFSTGLCTGDPSASTWSHAATTSGVGNGSRENFEGNFFSFFFNSTDDSNVMHSKGWKWLVSGSWSTRAPNNPEPITVKVITSQTTWKAWTGSLCLQIIVSWFVPQLRFPETLKKAKTITELYALTVPPKRTPALKRRWV